MSNLFGRGYQFVVTMFLGVLVCSFVFVDLNLVSAADNKPQPVATAVALRGDVVVKNADGKSRKLAAKDSLYLQDTISTGPRGRLQILFTDNTIYSLGSNSELKLKDYSWDPEKKKGKIKTEVKDGVFRVMGGIIAKTTPENFTTETQVATIGIRGSMYSTSFDKAKGLSVIFEGGKGVTVSNATGTKLITEPGFGSHVTSWRSSASEPEMMSDQDVSRMYQGLKFSRRGQSPATVKTGRGKLPPPVFTAKDVAALKKGGGKGIGRAFPHAELTSAVEAQPGKAAEVFKDAVVNKDVAIGDALGAVLQGMVNTDRQQFDKVIKDAVGYGLTKEEARKIVDRLKGSNGVCP